VNLLKVKMKLRNNKFSVLEQKMSEEMILSKMIAFVTGESKARDGKFKD
jgi:hypothetical protein